MQGVLKALSPRMHMLFIDLVRSSLKQAVRVNACTSSSDVPANEISKAADLIESKFPGLRVLHANLEEQRKALRGQLTEQKRM